MGRLATSDSSKMWPPLPFEDTTEATNHLSWVSYLRTAQGLQQSCPFATEARWVTSVCSDIRWTSKCTSRIFSSHRVALLGGLLDLSHHPDLILLKYCTSLVTPMRMLVHVLLVENTRSCRSWACISISQLVSRGWPELVAGGLFSLVRCPRPDGQGGAVPSRAAHMLVGRLGQTEQFSSWLTVSWYEMTGSGFLMD